METAVPRASKLLFYQAAMSITQKRERNENPSLPRGAGHFRHEMRIQE